MGEQSESFATEVEELFAKRLHGFAEWVATQWTFKDGEGGADQDMNPEQVEGWNRCCEGLKGAVQMWLEETGP